MSIINVKTRSTHYDIIIEYGSLSKLGQIAAELHSAGNAAVVSDANVAPLYGQCVLSSLKAAGFKANLITIPAGEEHKNLDAVKFLYSEFNSNEITRSDIIIALGGGVTGDITGFAAGTYLRGVPYIQVPTTLLSQIDSSVGGKTGVDLDEGKNLAGIFNQPKAVLIDPATLDTVSDEIFCDGMAEAIKYGCIRNRELFEFIETQDIKGEALLHLIEACVTIKRDIVEKDELDTGDRMILNFGHTIGHAIEKCGNFTKYTHGKAISAGMVKACEIGEALGITQKGTCNRLKNLLSRYNLPLTYSENREDIKKALLSDKKIGHGGINFIFLKHIGESVIIKMPLNAITKFLD